MIVYAQGTQDDVNAVRWARHNNVPARCALEYVALLQLDHTRRGWSGHRLNTPDLSLKGWQHEYYGKNFERLTQVKH